MHDSAGSCCLRYLGSRNFWGGIQIDQVKAKLSIGIKVRTPASRQGRVMRLCTRCCAC